MVIIINDLGKPSPSLTSLFEETRIQQVQFLDESAMIVELQKVVFRQLDLKQESALFIYPGESARRVRSLGFNGHFPWQEVFAKRIWFPGSDPVVLVHSMGWGIRPEIENVVVVDDVISSGATIALVRARNGWKFPRATWYAAVPVTRKEKISNYKKIFSCLMVRDVGGKKVPINSLSTLIADPAVRQSYFARNFEKGFEEKFLETLR